MHVLCIWGSPREILIFRRSETTSSAFSGMMNSIWEKLHYAYSQNNIQHILTCKGIMNPKCYILVLVFKLGLRNRKATQLRTSSSLHQLIHACMLRPLSCAIDRVVSSIDTTRGRQPFCKPIYLSTTRV